ISAPWIAPHQPMMATTRAALVPVKPKGIRFFEDTRLRKPRFSEWFITPQVNAFGQRASSHRPSLEKRCLVSGSKKGPACAGPLFLKRAVLFYGRYETAPNGLNVAVPV